MPVWFVIALVVAGLASSCESRTCTQEGRYGLGVTVRDAHTTTPVCDARVLLVEGAFREELRPRPFPGCPYWGALERPGTYRIEVNAPGYKPSAIENVVVRQEEDACHVTATDVTLDLEPDPNAPRDAGSD